MCSAMQTLHVKLGNEEKKMKATHDPINVHYTSRKNDEKWKQIEKKQEFFTSYIENICFVMLIMLIYRHTDSMIEH